MARIQLATGRIQYDEETEDYYFSTESGESFFVPFEKMETGEGKFIWDKDTDSHHIVTASGNVFTFRDNGVLQSTGLTAEEVYSTVSATKMTVPSDEEVLLPEQHNMIIEGPYQVEGTLQVEGKLTIL